MNALTNWDYDKSVKKVSGMVSDLKSVTLKKSTLTDSIATELFIAREELSNRGSRPDSDNSQNWTSYLKVCGLARQTVHEWLDHYEPIERRLLSDDEYQLKQEAKRREEMNVKEANNDRVNHAIKAGKIPKDWNDVCQKLYEQKIKENKERDKRTEKWKEDLRKETEEREKKTATRNAEREEINILLDGFQGSLTKRIDFKERIRLSHEGKDDPFIDAIMDYLETLDDDNRRIEACYNIIKVCKGVANDLQVKK
jgi:hypothetical protein